MSTSDKKEYGLVTHQLRLRLRHTAKTPHYRLPKPYRHKSLPYERPRSRLKLVFYGGAAALIAVLISQIAEMARQNRRERELPIVAVQVSPAPIGTPAAPASRVPPDSPAPYASLNEPAPSAAPAPDAKAALMAGVSEVPADTGADDGAMAPAVPTADTSAAAPPSSAAQLPQPAAAPRKARALRPPPAPPALPAEPPDPDVVLVTAILKLAPLILGEQAGPDAACSDAGEGAAHCADLNGLVP